MTYKNELTKAMTWLGNQPDTVFMGQGVKYTGHGLFATLKDVPMDKRIELPVMENTQLGMGIGLAIAGKVPISIYPRMNFLMCAMDALVNHLNCMETYSNGQYKPRVIIRVAVGSTVPMNPGVQHCGEYPLVLSNIRIVKLKNDWDIQPAYQEAYYSKKSTLLIEYADLF